MPFILIVTNLCPFITTMRWAQLVKKHPEECRSLMRISDAIQSAFFDDF